jgi:dihydrofolate synthase/folylpolyglutamate synthase
MAFECFARSKPDLAVLEVGMGGRLDATNVVDPRLSIITDISLDHQKYLGDTLAEISREKAGIIRPGGIVITLPQMPEANDVIGNAILDSGATAVNAVPYVPPVSPGSMTTLSSGRGKNAIRNMYPLDVMGTQIIVESPLAGRHQLRNVALAIAAAVELHNQGMAQITPGAIEQGIRDTHWPGRFQVLPATDANPEYVFDVAHNPAGAWALRSTLSSAYPDSGDHSSDRSGITLVFGAMRDKAIREIAGILFPIASHVVVTHADNPRAAMPDEIRQAAGAPGAFGVADSEIEEAPNVAEALQRARTLAGNGGPIVVTGSIYIVGEAMRILGVRI